MLGKQIAPWFSHYRDLTPISRISMHVKKYSSSYQEPLISIEIECDSFVFFPLTTARRWFPRTDCHRTARRVLSFSRKINLKTMTISIENAIRDDATNYQRSFRPNYPSIYVNKRADDPSYPRRQKNERCRELKSDGWSDAIPNLDETTGYDAKFNHVWFSCSPTQRKRSLDWRVHLARVRFSHRRFREGRGGQCFHWLSNDRFRKQNDAIFFSHRNLRTPKFEQILWSILFSFAELPALPWKPFV